MRATSASLTVIGTFRSITVSRNEARSGQVGNAILIFAVLAGFAILATFVVAWLGLGLMTRQRLGACLKAVRWNADALAEAVDVHDDLVNSGLAGRKPGRRAAAAWIEALSFLRDSPQSTRRPVQPTVWDQAPIGAGRSSRCAQVKRIACRASPWWNGEADNLGRRRASPTDVFVVATIKRAGFDVQLLCRGKAIAL